MLKLKVGHLMGSASKSTDMGFKNRKLVKQLADGNLEFTLSLYKSYVQSADVGNAIFSPFGILFSLSMISMGARNNTREELRKALKLDVFRQDIQAPQAILDVLESLGVIGSPKKLPFVLDIANRIYIQGNYKMLLDYKNALTDYYGTDVKMVDFIGDAEAVSLAINKWAQEVTGENIKDLIPPGMLDNMTRLLLINAVHFNGKWQKQFNPTSTNPRPFFKTKTDILEVPMMCHVDKFSYAENALCKILELPYTGDRLGLFMVLPSNNVCLSSLEEELSPRFLRGVMKSMKLKTVEAIFPKFKLDISLSLREMLGYIGIQDLFSRNADLSGISPAKDLHVATVLHKAFIDFNEEGTGAAVATTVVKHVAKGPGSSNQMYTFNADHPFMFFVFDKASEMILFFGRLTDPLETEAIDEKHEYE